MNAITNGISGSIVSILERTNESSKYRKYNRDKTTNYHVIVNSEKFRKFHDIILDYHEWENCYQARLFLCELQPNLALS